MAEEKPLGPNTKTTLGVAGTCVTVFLGGALWINASLSSVEGALNDLGHRIDLFDVRLKAVGAMLLFVMACLVILVAASIPVSLALR